MKKRFYIFAFRSYGVFTCIEVQNGNEINLIGKFQNQRKEYTFIKQEQDIQL